MKDLILSSLISAITIIVTGLGVEISQKTPIIEPLAPIIKIDTGMSETDSLMLDSKVKSFEIDSMLSLPSNKKV